MGVLSQAMGEIAQMNRLQGLDQAQAARQKRLDGRQDKQWADEDAGKAALKEANQAAAMHLLARMSPQQDPAAAPGLSSSLAPPSMDQQASLQGPQQGLSLASPATSAPAPAGLAGQLSLGGDAAGLASGVPKLAKADKVSEGQAIFEAATKRGEVLLKHGRYDDFMANHAMQAKMANDEREGLMARAAQRGDAAYAQTGDPTVYMKEMSPFANTGIDFIGSRQKGVDKDGRPVWEVSLRNSITGVDETHEMSADQILDGANRMRVPQYAMQVALKGGIAQVQARAKMTEQDNKATNDRETNRQKAVDEANIEILKQRGRMSEIFATGAEARRTKQTAGWDDLHPATKPSERVGLINSGVSALKVQLESLDKAFKEDSKDMDLDPKTKEEHRETYNKTRDALVAEMADLNKRRELAFGDAGLGLATDLTPPAKSQGLSSARPGAAAGAPSTPARGLASATAGPKAAKGPTISNWPGQ